MLQGAGFTGAAAGVNLARDIEQGWLDRLLVSPAPRWVLLAGTVLAASARSLIPATFVLAVALALGAGWPGVDGLLVTYLMVAAMAAVAACWGLDAGAALQEPVGGAADAGGDDGADPHHHGLRAAGAAAGLAPGHRPRQPGDPGGRSGAAGLRRQRHLGGNLARAAGPDRDAGGPRSALALREMRRTGEYERRAEKRRRPSEMPSASCARTGWRASATGSPSPTPGPAPAAIPGSGTGTPASRRSSGAASSRRGPEPSWRACWRRSAPTASSATRSSGTGRSR